MDSLIKIDLSGQVAAVTGGGGVLGREMCRALAAAGAKVAVLDRLLENAQQTVEILEKEGGTALAVASDVLKKESLEEANQKIKEKLGTVNLLLNGAGGNHPGGTTSKEYLELEDITGANKDETTFFTLNPENIEFVFRLNFMGSLLPSQVFGKDMASAKSGNIINISSMNAFTPLTKIPAYSGAKAAISNFTQWLAVHFSKVGIRVNAIAPGFFITVQNKTLLQNPDGSLTARGQKIISQTPMGKFGEPADLSGVLLWLASEKLSGFVTGTVIPIDGGFSAYSGV